MLYGLLGGDIFPLFITCVIGEVFALLFIAVYFVNATDKKYVLQAAGFVASFLAILTTYVVLGRLGVTDQSAGQVGDWSGYVAVCVSLVLNASPFETIKKVIETKSASSIPILLCSAAVTSNTIWVVYGFVVDDLIVAIPNAICAAFGVVQVGLYVVYKPNRSKFDLPKPREIRTPLDCASEFTIVISPTSSRQ